MHGVHGGPILKVNAAFRKRLLHRFDELIDKRKKLLSRRARLPHTQIQGIVQVLLIVSASIDVHGEQVLRRHSGAGGVQLQLSDGDARAICPKISEAEDAAGVRDANEPNVFLWPISQDLLYFAAACDREIHAALPTINVAKLEAGFPDGRVVNDRQKASWIRHYSPIEKGFVVVEQVDQVNVAIEVRGLVAELHHHPA